MKKFFVLLFVIYFVNMASFAYAKSNDESFVDKIVNDPLVFEENANDEFLSEKKEINQLVLNEKFGEAKNKCQELDNKEIRKYGEKYTNPDIEHVKLRIDSLITEKKLRDIFPYNTKGYSNNELKQKLQDENTWKSFDNEIEKLNQSMELRSYEFIFKVDKKIVKTCNDILGSSDPVTLKRTMNLIRDYSILGDSTTALKLGQDLLPKVEKVFGKKSDEAVSVMRLMANDYKVLGNRYKCEELIMKAIEINEEKYKSETGEHSVEMLSSLVDLINLKDDRFYVFNNLLTSRMYYISSKLSEEERKRSGINRMFPRSLKNNEKYMKLLKRLDEEEKLLKVHNDPFNYIELISEISKIPRLTKIYSYSLSIDIMSVAMHKMYFGNFHYKTIEAMCNVGDDYLNLNQIDEALKIAQDAFMTSQKIYGDNHPCTVNAIHTLTNVYRKMGKYSEALKLDLVAYDISKKIFTKDTVYSRKNPLPFGYQTYETFRNNLKKSLDERFESIDKLISIYKLTGRNDEAQRLYNQSEKMKNKLLKNDAYAKYSYLEATDKSYELSLIMGLAETKEKEMVMGDIIADYEGLKNYDLAIKYYEELLIKYRFFSFETYEEILPKVSYLYNLTGNYDKSINLYKDELLNGMYEKIISDENYVINRENGEKDKCSEAYTLGDALKGIGENKEALICLEKAINGYEKLRDLNDGLTADDKKQWFSTVVPYYKEAASFFITQNKYDEAFKTAELCKARTLVEQYSELLATYNSDLGEEDISKLDNYQKNITQYKEQIKDAMMTGSDDVKFNLKIAQLQIVNEYVQYKQQLQEKYPKYKEMLNTTALNEDILNEEQLKQILPYNSCFIDFTLVKKSNASNRKSDEIMAFVVSKNGSVKGFNISVDYKFFEQCNLYHDLLAYSNIERMRADNKYLWKLPYGSYKITNGRQSPAQNAAVVNSTKALNNLRQNLSIALSDTLLQPLQNHISTNTIWIISPDGELNNIPFETLQFNNKTVIESIDVSYVPSLAVLKLMKEQETKNSSLKNRKGLFAMGDAVYGNSDAAASRGSLIDFSQNIRSTNDKIAAVDLTQLKWANLPGTGKELDQVSTVFDDKEIIRGKNASETNLKILDKNGNLSEYKYLLFATHGLFVPERPELSSIVLSQGLDKNNDGYVTVGEWMGYNLNSDLVYLSACESGLGEYQAGEGIVGIPYALTIAGNKDTVMSLWKVNDEATAEFSASFFKKLSKGQSEVKALNETKREFLSNPNTKFNSPSVWAAFLLYGI